MDGTETSSTSSETSVNATDQIADILMGEEPTEEQITEDSVDEETLSDESTEEVKTSDENLVDDTEETLETEEEVVAEVEEEADESWGSVLGIDEDKLVFDEDGNLQGVTVKVDGETSQVGLNDLLVGYQNNKHVTQKSQRLSEEMKQFETQRTELQESYATKLENAELLADYLGKQLTSGYDNVNWEQLRVEDPAEYAAMRQDYATKAREIQQAQEAIKQEKVQVQEQQQQEFQKQHQAYLAEQFDKMIANNPTWSDESTLKSDMEGIKNFASNQYGFTDQDFNGVSDARIIEVLKDAKAYREGVKIAKKKLKKPVPKFQKSAGKPVRKTSKLAKLTKRAKSMQGANKRAAETDAITELLLGG